MPCDYSLYPKDWKEISRSVKERAGNRCEFCQVENGAIGARDKTGKWWNEDSIHRLNSDNGYFLFGEFPKMIKIVLTVAHYPDPDPANCDETNLWSLCQKCHNQLDAPMRAKNAAVTRRKKRLERTGQMEMAL